MSRRKGRSHSRRRRGRRKNGNWFTRMSLGGKIGVCVGSFFLCIIASGVIFVAAKLGKMDTEDIKSEDLIVNQEAEESAKGYTNFALFGIDSRSGKLDKGTRSDTIIVASLNNETKEVRMSSVYRDTLLNVGNGELAKCNAAYSYGGPTQAINMLNQNLDLNIKDFATVDFAAIANAIDMLGGVEIDVQPEEIKAMNKYIGETARVADKEANLISEPGKQLLDGVQATTYARIRSTAGGDFKRAERQRIVIEKVVAKIQDSSLGTLNKMIDKLLPTIKTSLSTAEILSYAKDFTKYKIGESSGFPFAKTTDTVSGLGSIVIPVTLKDNVIELHDFLYGEEEEEYEPSSDVNDISSNIEAKVGPRVAVEDEFSRKKEDPDEASDEGSDEESSEDSEENGSDETKRESVKVEIEPIE